MKTRIALLLILTVLTATVCLGMDCQGNMPAALPLQVPDGAYAGPVTTRLTWTENGVERPGSTGASYRIVHIVDGSLLHIRRNLNRNGPFGCEIVAPGEQVTVALIGHSGFDVQTITITETWSLGYHYVVTSDIGGIHLTGEGTAEVREINGALEWWEHDEVVGANIIATRTSSGTLQRIGEIGTVPAPEGMNGFWVLHYVDSGAADGVEIRGLRVEGFIDAEGPQVVFSSGLSTSSVEPGAFVRFSFDANTSFLSDPVLMRYTITFLGSVAADGTITGTTAFAATGKEPIELATELLRVPSSDCPM